MTSVERAHIVVVGAGLAGLTAALNLADSAEVTVLAKRGLDEAATAWAQGGIVGVLGADDSVEAHVRDTLDATPSTPVGSLADVLRADQQARARTESMVRA